MPIRKHGPGHWRATLLGYFGYFFGPRTLVIIAGAFGLRIAFVFAALLPLLLLLMLMAPIMAQAGSPAMRGG